MAEVTVKLRNHRQAPRKLRLIIDVVRGAPVETAMNQLGVMPQRAAFSLRKLLKSGVAAAKQKGLDESKLYLAKAICDQGPAYKRRQINSRGRASMIKKFTSHVTLTLAEGAAARKGRS